MVIQHKKDMNMDWLDNQAKEKFGEFGFHSCSIKEQEELVYLLTESQINSYLK